MTAGRITIGSGARPAPDTPTLADSRYGRTVALYNSPQSIPIAQAAGDWSISTPQDWTIYLLRLPSRASWLYDPGIGLVDIEVTWGTGGAAMSETIELQAGGEVTLHVAAAQAPTITVRKRADYANNVVDDRVVCTVCPGRPSVSILPGWPGDPTFVRNGEGGVIEAFYWQIPVPMGTQAVYVRPLMYALSGGWRPPALCQVYPDTGFPIGSDGSPGIMVAGVQSSTADDLDFRRMGQVRIPLSRSWCSNHRINVICLPTTSSPTEANLIARLQLQWEVLR